VVDWWSFARADAGQRRRRLLAPVDPVLRVCLAIAAAVTKVGSLSGQRLVHSGDLIWDEIGALPLADHRFWFNERPVTVPLLHRLVGFSEPRVVTVQIACDVIAWTLLAQVVSKFAAARGAGLVAFALVLGLSLTSGVQGWDLVIRSESAAMSFLVLALAGAVAITVAPAHGRAWRVGWSAAALTGALLSAFARDNVAYVLVIVASFVPLGALLAAERPLDLRAWARRAAPVAVVSLGLFAVAAASRANEHAAARFEGPLMNVIFERVLGSPGTLAYFERELGMPVSPAVRARRGHTLPRGAAGVKSLAPFRAWVLQDGYSGYQRYLLTHFPATARAAWRSFEAVSGDVEDRHTHRGRSRSSRFLDSFFVDPLAVNPLASVALLGAAGLLGLFSGRGGARVLAAFCLCCLAVSLTQAYVCFHGDAMEVGRHSVNVGLFLRLAAVIAVCLGVDRGSALAERLLFRRAPGADPG